MNTVTVVKVMNKLDKVFLGRVERQSSWGKNMIRDLYFQSKGEVLAGIIDEMEENDEDNRVSR